MGSSNSDNNNNNNRLALQQASDIQQDTLSAVRRIQLQASETESVGITTLEELQLQRETLDGILKAGDRLHGQLDTAEKLQNRFGRWSLSLSGGRRAAAKDAKKSIKEQKAKAKLEEERSLRISASMGSTTSTSASSSYGSLSSSSEQPVRVKHTSSLVKSRPKKAGRSHKATTCDDGTPKGLLYGIDASGHENEGELNDLADADRAIDQELDAVSKQLEGLLGMSRAMGSEIRTQNSAMDEVESTLVKADYKSRVVNERGRRFLAGKPRAELDKQRALGLPF
jgi:hypothetical protein